jgi:DNA-binding transcriptional regulator PaaX
MTSKVTDMERAVLGAYFRTDYGDGPGSETWSFDVISHSGIEGRQARGAMSSLVKKGLIYVNGSGKDAATALTEAGIALCAKLEIK